VARSVEVVGLRRRALCGRAPRRRAPPQANPSRRGELPYIFVGSPSNELPAVQGPPAHHPLPPTSSPGPRAV
jgi:hypothetical protein